MIESPLLRIVERRKKSISEVDQHSYPEDLVRNDRLWPNGRPSLRDALKRTGLIKVLAEVKKKSPSAGALNSSTAIEIAEPYIQTGCHGVSILMDQPNFAGHPKDMEECVKAWPDTAFLFKDFVVTPYQIYLAKYLGASAVLLMTQVLEDHELDELFQLTRKVNIEAFVEVHSVEQFKRGTAYPAELYGINARDFETVGMPTSLDTAPNLLAQHSIPENSVLIAQSGIESIGDIETLDQKCPAGKPDAVQIGTSLCRGGNTLPEWFTNWLKRN